MSPDVIQTPIGNRTHKPKNKANETFIARLALRLDALKFIIKVIHLRRGES